MFVVSSLVGESWLMLTVVDELLVVLDRLEREKMLALSLVRHNRTQFGSGSRTIVSACDQTRSGCRCSVGVGNSEMEARQID